MNKFEKLINELCPEGVEFKELGNVCKFKYGKGNTIPKKGGIYPVYGCNGVVGTHDEFNNEDSPIIGHIGSAGVVIWAEGKHYVTYNGTICIPDNRIVVSKFIYYLLLCLNLAKLTKGSQPFLSYGTIKKLKIPIPPLPIQEEIVSILDKFTQLEAELEAELEARKKQYDHYRDELLTFPKERIENGEGRVEWKTLGEVSLKTSNINWKKNISNYKYIDLSSVNRSDNQIYDTIEINSTNAPSRAKQIVKENDVIFGTTRPTLKRISFIPKKFSNQICSTGFCVFRTDRKIMLPKFLFFLLQTSDFYNYVSSNEEGAGYPSISNSKLNKFIVPVPPLKEQEHIVNILEKLDTLVNNISIGLPAEIEARQKQYEYYRKKLLTFKEVK